MSGAEWLTLIQLVLAVGLAWVVLVIVQYCNVAAAPIRRTSRRATVPTNDQAS